MLRRLVSTRLLYTIHKEVEVKVPVNVVAENAPVAAPAAEEAPVEAPAEAVAEEEAPAAE